ncbi:unnamed protein product [Owenia fusiformis]|uniref:Uncharacterized protein n=1 Tax=Owenia fusiformis TaxID=6347 RepID=A0A8J1T7H9_OWEFU|nr:unnamed protein product [Owenia fusiformis]
MKKCINLHSCLIDHIINLCDANDLLELLSGTENTLFPDGLIATVLKQLQPALSKECWKRNPMALHCYRWCLFKMSHPHLGEFIDHVLPPALLLIDDYLPKNKISGIKCVQHIVNNVAPTQLLRYGRADVLFSALESQLYTNDQKLLKNVHACILSIIEILDRSKMEKTLSVTRYDSILKTILTNMEIDDKIKFRRFYSGILIQYIEQMKLSIVRFLKRLLPIVANYLEIYDGPEETSRINILKALNLTIKYAWPRIPHHSDDILKCLLKFMDDISTDDSLTSLTVKQMLMQEAQDVLILLNYSTGENIVKLLAGIQDVHDNEIFKNAIVNVCTSTNKE